MTRHKVRRNEEFSSMSYVPSTLTDRPVTTPSLLATAPATRHSHPSSMLTCSTLACAVGSLPTTCGLGANCTSRLSLQFVRKTAYCWSCRHQACPAIGYELKSLTHARKNASRVGLCFFRSRW